MAAGTLPADAAVYAIANYTALPPVHAALNAMEAAEPAVAPATPAPIAEAAGASAAPTSCHPERSAEGAEPRRSRNLRAFRNSRLSRICYPEPPVVIAHMLPDLLNLYGDGGNVRILEQRLRWRGIPAEVRRIQHGEAVDFSQVDLVFMGGGPDREQKLASEQLLAMRDELAVYVEGDGPLLAICGGYQYFSARQWLWGDELVPGLGLIDMETRLPGSMLADRSIHNMVLESPRPTHPVVGYENHAGRTYLGEGVEGFGRVVSSCGHGNNDDDRVEGARYKYVVGTYSHGPLLSKNRKWPTGCSPALSNAVRSAPEPRPPISSSMIAPSSPPTPPWSSACCRRRFNADACSAHPWRSCGQSAGSSMAFHW